ncbi:MAG TPA: phosphate ABC transporter permease subunit PstC [Firmicutes bacterium]|nr:phosphate ABC transporter permease subunit PstC [Bacillota bacterium]
MNRSRTKEKAGKAVFAGTAVICIIAVVVIFAFIIIRSIPAISKIGFFDFLFGSTWDPDVNDIFTEALAGQYGVLTMIVGSLFATVGALAVGGILGYFMAVYLAFFCKGKLKKIFSTVVNLLAGIPSVIYGFFGIRALTPILGWMSPNGGASGLLLTSLILGIMIMPTVVALSKTSLEAVPRSYYEGALALGATHEQAVFKTMVPAAKSGITASLILGIGRALGETMAVVMLAGNSAQIPTGLFQSFRTLTANIVLEMGYAGEVQMGALFATGLVLLIFIAIINFLVGLVRSDKKSDKAKIKKEWLGALKNKINFSKVGKVVSWIAAIVGGVFLVAIVVYILINGLPHITGQLLFGEFSFGGEVTILPAIVATLMTVVVSLIIAIPLGVAAAIFLNEYTQKGSKLIALVRSAVDILSGVPSIVYGLFGSVTFVLLFGGSYSILAGSFTVSIMLLPTVIRSTEESLKSVPDAFREGSLALGAGKLRTIFKVVLPSAMPGIISAVILSIGRVVSESAPFMYTMGAGLGAMPTGYLSSGCTLAVALYSLSRENFHTNEAYATACVLIIIVLALNLLAEFVGKKLQKKLSGDSSNGIRTKHKRKAR